MRQGGSDDVKVLVWYISETSVHSFLIPTNLITRHFHALWWTKCNKTSPCISINEDELDFCGRLSMQGARVREST